MRELVALCSLVMAFNVHAGFVTGFVVGSAVSGTGSSSTDKSQPQESATMMPSSTRTSIITCKKYTAIEGSCEFGNQTVSLMSQTFSLQVGMFSKKQKREDHQNFWARCVAEFEKITGQTLIFSSPLSMPVVKETNTTWTAECRAVISHISAHEYAKKAGYSKIEKMGVSFQNGQQYLIMEVSK